MTDVSKRVKELDLEIGFENARLERLKQQYRRNCGNFIKRLFTLDENYVLKRKKYQTKISNQKELLDSLEKIRLESTALKFDNGMNFFARVISLVENEEYCYRRLTLRDSALMPPAIGCSADYTYQVIDNKIGLIARKEVAESIIEAKYRNPRKLEARLVNKNEKNIIAETFYNLEIFDGEKVPDTLIYDFPYLEQVCSEIICLKLNNPDVSEEDICKFYLRNLKINLKIRRGAYHK